MQTIQPIEAAAPAVPFWMQPAFRRDAWIGISFANFCFLRIWSEILTYKRSDTYVMKSPPLPAEYLAAMLNVLIVAALLLLAMTVVRRSHDGRAPAFARRAFLISLLIPLNALRSVLSNRYTYLKSPLFTLIGQRGVVMVGIGLALAGLLLLVMLNRPLVRVFAAFFLISAPFTLITFSQAIWRAARFDPARFADKPAAPALPRKDGPRVVWVIFDEWDYRLSFIDRDPTVHLPEIDRFRAGALFATNAQRPGDETPISIPALTTGRRVERVRYANTDQILIAFTGAREPVPWNAVPNIFGRVRQAGFNTSVTGWYHPYCRILNQSLTDCEWWDMAMQFNSLGDHFTQILTNQARSLFETSLLSVFGQSLEVEQHVRTYHAILERAKRVANLPDYGLVYIHFPTPHAPHAFNRFSGKFDRRNSPIQGYLDSLVLVDRSLAELRRSMEASGAWDNTTILLSADHGYRESQTFDGHPIEERVPYVLKTAGQDRAIAYDSPFSTLLTQDLILALMRGEVKTPQAVVAWLDTHRAR